MGRPPKYRPSSRIYSQSVLALAACGVFLRLKIGRDQMRQSSYFDLMDLNRTKFGGGPREVGGGVDLINHYNLRPIHEHFCKTSQSSSTSDTHYLQNVVGESVIMKGEGMELNQLLKKPYSVGNRHANVHPFDFQILREAFHIGEPTPLGFPYAEKGRATSFLKLSNDSKDKKRRKKDQIWEDSKKEPHKCSKMNKEVDDIKNEHCDIGSIHLKTLKDKQKNLKVKKSAMPQK